METNAQYLNKVQNEQNQQFVQNAGINANNMGLAQNPYVSSNVQNAQANSSFLSSFNTNDFLKGALIGAAAGYLLTNEKAQKAIMKTFAKGTSMLQMGVEELKERFEDAKAEMEQ